jgi:hypothetical protein
MDANRKEPLPKPALRLFGTVFIIAYPPGWVRPAGSVRHGGGGYDDLQISAGIYAILDHWLPRKECRVRGRLESRLQENNHR